MKEHLDVYLAVFQLLREDLHVEGVLLGHAALLANEADHVDTHVILLGPATELELALEQVEEGFLVLFLRYFALLLRVYHLLEESYVVVEGCGVHFQETVELGELLPADLAVFVVGIDAQRLQEALLHFSVQAFHDRGVLPENVNWDPEVIHVLLFDFVRIRAWSLLDKLGDTQFVRAWYGQCESLLCLLVFILLHGVNRRRDEGLIEFTAAVCLIDRARLGTCHS